MSWSNVNASCPKSVMITTPNIYRLQPGEIRKISSSEKLVTTVGACVAIVAVNESANLAIMNHFMLPYEEKGSSNKLTPLWYCEPAMDKLLETICAIGPGIGAFSFHAFGGARLYANKDNSEQKMPKTVDALYDYCQRKKLNVNTEHIGGEFGRKVSVSLGPLNIDVEIQDKRYGEV